MRGKRIALLAALAIGMTAGAAIPARADAMARAIFMNTAYCAGVAEGYSETLKQAGGWAFGGKASAAQRVAGELKRRADTFGRRNGFSSAQGQQAANQGRATIERLLAGGNWRGGSDVPQAAFRQYQHCATLAEL